MTTRSNISRGVQDHSELDLSGTASGNQPMALSVGDVLLTQDGLSVLMDWTN